MNFEILIDVGSAFFEIVEIGAGLRLSGWKNILSIAAVASDGNS